MKSEWNIEGAMREYRSRTLAKLEAVGALVEKAAKVNADNVFSDSTGALKDKITHEVKPERMSVWIISGIVYGAIHELGGVIKPDKAGALTIPISDEAKSFVKSGGSARDMDLFMLERDGKPPLLCKQSSKGEIIPMFVLMKSVKIPARPYLMPAVLENKDKINKIMAL